MSDSVLYMNNTIVRNAIAKDGGAIYLLGYSNLTIQLSTFTNCVALNKGGAVYASSFDQMLIIASNFSSNKASISGDALYAANSIGYMNVNDSSIFVSSIPSNFMYLSSLEEVNITTVSVYSSTKTLTEAIASEFSGIYAENVKYFDLVSSKIFNMMSSGKGGCLYISENTNSK